MFNFYYFIRRGRFDYAYATKIIIVKGEILNERKDFLYLLFNITIDIYRRYGGVLIVIIEYLYGVPIPLRFLRKFYIGSRKRAPRGGDNYKEIR